MKTAVIYFSKTGHSQKLALAIAAELGVQAENIKESPDLADIDLLYIVGGIYGGKSDPKMIDYVKKLDNNQVKQAVLVTSSASKAAKQEVVRTTLQTNNIEVLQDEFTCQGSFLIFGVSHPNKHDIANAVSFARKTGADLNIN